MTPVKINNETSKLRIGILPRTRLTPDFVSNVIKNNGDNSKPAKMVICHVPATSHAGLNTAA